MGITTYRQCNLRRGRTHQTAWLPTQYAIPGRYLELCGENGWRVTSAGPFLCDGQFLSTNERDYRKEFPSL